MSQRWIGTPRQHPLSYFKVMAAFRLLLKHFRDNRRRKHISQGQAFVRGCIKERPLSVTAARGSGVYDRVLL
jgi:hypothetical protein